jgi:hypothetical protein
MNNSDCNGCKSKDMHIPVEGNFDNTAENVVKVTCRRMQKDQFNQQVNNVGIGDKDSDKENL